MVGRFCVPLWVLLAASCSTQEATNAAVGAAVGVAGAAVSRATGGCYANCQDGTVCNPNTGLCDRTYEVPLRPDALPAPTLSERCAMYRRDRIEERNRGIGDQHPAMLTLNKVLERCDGLLASQDPVDRACGVFELELTALESEGMGPKHPEVRTQTELWASCKTEAAAGSR